MGCSFGLRSGKKTDWIIEGLYRSLKLPEDATDEQIIERLYMPVLEIGGVKLADPIAACSLIERERIYAAIPNLLKMVNDTDESNSVRIVAAQTLCTLRNNEWLKPIKGGSGCLGGLSAESIITA